jgi:hypothetical protein
VALNQTTTPVVTMKMTLPPRPSRFLQARPRVAGKKKRFVSLRNGEFSDFSFFPYLFCSFNSSDTNTLYRTAKKKHELNRARDARLKAQSAASSSSSSSSKRKLAPAPKLDPALFASAQTAFDAARKLAEEEEEEEEERRKREERRRLEQKSKKRRAVELEERQVGYVSVPLRRFGAPF